MFNDVIVWPLVAILCYIFLRWIVTDMNRDRVWRLRDEAYDDGREFRPAERLLIDLSTMGVRRQCVAIRRLAQQGPSSPPAS